jgi:hypothetical protein
MEQSEGDMSLKNPVTPLGIDAGTVQLVVQRLNHYAAPRPDLGEYGFFLLQSGAFFSVYTREPKPPFFTTGHVLVTILLKNLKKIFSSLLTFLVPF